MHLADQVMRVEHAPEITFRNFAVAATHSLSGTVRRFVAARDTGTALTGVRQSRRVEFRVSQRRLGIFVERRHLRVGAGMASQAMHFSDENSFLSWCEADALRFAYPLVYTSLKRHGCALLVTEQSGARAA
jgi:hypothetical protein